jgi:hypothetical protein
LSAEYDAYGEVTGADLDAGLNLLEQIEAIETHDIGSELLYEAKEEYRGNLGE